MFSHIDNLSWFSQHLNTLRTHEHSPKVNVSLYVTAAPANDSAEQRRGSVLITDIRQMHRIANTASSGEVSERSLTRPSGEHEMNEKALERGIFTAKTTKNNGCDATTADPEKALTLQNHHHQRMPSDSSLATAYSAAGSSAAADEHRDVLKSGRPDTATLIREAVRSTPTHQRVLIAACGPNGLMCVVRDTTAGLISGDGPGVELHCEQFGW